MIAKISRLISVREAIATIERIALKLSASLAYEWGGDVAGITVLEQVPAAMQSQESPGVLAPGTKLFDVEQVAITMLGDPGNFSFVDAWPVAEPNKGE